MTPTPRQIVQAVAEAFDLEFNQVTAGTKKVEHVRARFAAMHLIVTDLRKTKEQTARALRLINHTTIIHGERRAARLLAEDGMYAAAVEDARRIASELAAGRPPRPKARELASQLATGRKIPPCLNVVPFRPRRSKPRAWLRVEDSGVWPASWYAENDARFCAVMAVEHPDLIVWDFERRRA